jgi:AcrR family transcriptional regulator
LPRPTPDTTAASAPPPARRADAERNRRRLLDAAVGAFAHDDGAALEAIARAAGVGIGTLYRHFPTRAALVEAVYRDEQARLCADAPDLLASHGTAAAALRAWIGRYAEFVATKRSMGEALRALIAEGTITSGETRRVLGTAIQPTLDAGARDGTLRADVRAEDVVAGLAGAVVMASDAEQRERLLDLLLAGLRP